MNTYATELERRLTENGAILQEMDVLPLAGHTGIVLCSSGWPHMSYDVSGTGILILPPPPPPPL